MEAGSRREDVGEGEESLKSGSKGSITQESDHTPDSHHSASKIARQPSLPCRPNSAATHHFQHSYPSQGRALVLPDTFDHYHMMGVSIMLSKV